MTGTERLYLFDTVRQIKSCELAKVMSLNWVPGKMPWKTEGIQHNTEHITHKFIYNSPMQCLFPSCPQVNDSPA